MEAIEAVEGVAGRSAWDPRLLISVWIYAYTTGVSSAREISRLCRYHPAYQWLTGLGGDQPSHAVGFSGGAWSKL